MPEDRPSRREAAMVLAKVMQSTGLGPQEAVEFALILLDELMKRCSSRGDFSFIVERALARFHGVEYRPKFRLEIPKRGKA